MNRGTRPIDALPLAGGARRRAARGSDDSCAAGFACQCGGTRLIESRRQLARLDARPRGRPIDARSLSLSLGLIRFPPVKRGEKFSSSAFLLLSHGVSIVYRAMKRARPDMRGSRPVTASLRAPLEALIIYAARNRVQMAVGRTHARAGDSGVERVTAKKAPKERCRGPRAKNAAMHAPFRAPLDFHTRPSSGSDRVKTGRAARSRRCVISMPHGRPAGVGGDAPGMATRREMYGAGRGARRSVRGSDSAPGVRRAKACRLLCFPAAPSGSGPEGIFVSSSPERRERRRRRARRECNRKSDQ